MVEKTLHSRVGKVSYISLTMAQLVNAVSKLIISKFVILVVSKSILGRRYLIA